MCVPVFAFQAVTRLRQILHSFDISPQISIVDLIQSSNYNEVDDEDEGGDDEDIPPAASL